MTTALHHRLLRITEKLSEAAHLLQQGARDGYHSSLEAFTTWSNKEARYAYWNAAVCGFTGVLAGGLGLAGATRTPVSPWKSPLETASKIASVCGEVGNHSFRGWTIPTQSGQKISERDIQLKLQLHEELKRLNQTISDATGFIVKQ